MPATSGRRATGRRSSGAATAGNNGVLAGAIVYVDAFLDDRSPMREEYGRVLRNLGADVRARLPAKMTTLTHLVWKDGDAGTAQKAEEAGVPLVSPSWVHACDKGGVRAPEVEHRADFESALYGVAAKRKKAQRRKPTLEPTIDEWQGVDNLDLCLSSSQRDPPKLYSEYLDGDDDDALLGSSSSSSSSSDNRGGNRGSTAKAAGKSSSKRAASSSSRKVSTRVDSSFGAPAPRSSASSASGSVGGGGSGSGSSNNASVESGKGGALSGVLCSKPRSTSLLSSPKAKTKTYGSARGSRLSTESAALGKRSAGFLGERGARKGGGGGGLSSREGEWADDNYGDGDAATEVEDEAAETAEAEGVATDVDCSRRSFDNNNNSSSNNKENPAAAAGLGRSTTAANGDDQAEGVADLDKTITAADGDGRAEEGTDLDKTITEDYFPDDANNDDANNDDANDDDGGNRSPATPAPAPAGGAERGVASPLIPAAEAASTWTVGGRGLLGRGSARKSGRLSGLGSAGRVAGTGILKSPGLYVGGGGGSAGGNRLTRAGAGCGTLSSGGDSTAFDMSDDDGDGDGDGDETERTVIDSTDCESKAARDRAGQAEAADDDHDSSPECSGAEEDPEKASDSSRKPGRRPFPRGAGNDGRDGGDAGVQQRSSPSPSPRLAALSGGGGSGGKGITTPLTRASKRAAPGRNATTSDDTMGGAGSASRARGPAATPGSGYAADRSAGPARTTKARARTRPAASSSAAAAAGVVTGHGPEQNTAAPEEEEGWGCGTCTLVNKVKDGKCNACGTARPRRPPRVRAAPAVSANGPGESTSLPPAMAKSRSDVRPAGQGEGTEEAEGGGGGGVLSGDVGDSPGGPWEGYAMLERSTASSSAKSNRASRPLAPASNRERSGDGFDGDGGGSLSRAASPASDAELSLASAEKKPRRQQRQQGLRGVLQGVEEIVASPQVDGADLSPPGAYLGSSGGAPQNSTGMDDSSGSSNIGNGPTGGGSPAAAEEEGDTVPAVRLFGVTTSSPSVVPAPAVDLLGRPPHEEAGTASSGRGAVPASRDTPVAGVVDGAGLHNAARGQGDDVDEGRGADVGGEEGKDEVETEVQLGGTVAAFRDGQVCQGRKDAGAAEEESETDTVKKSNDGGSLARGGENSVDSEVVSDNPRGLLDRILEDVGSGGGGDGCGAVRGDASLVALAVAGEGAHESSAAGPPPSHADDDLVGEAETSDGVQSGKRRASARLKRGSAAPEDNPEGSGNQNGMGHGSSPSLSTGQKEAGGACTADAVAGIDGAGGKKESTAMNRRGARGRSTRAANQNTGNPGQGEAARASTAAGAPDPKEAAPAANGGGRRRSTRGAAASPAVAAAAATAASLRGPGTPSTARVAAVYAMNKGPAATEESLDEVAAAAGVMRLLPAAAAQESQSPPPAAGTGPDGSDDAAATMMLIARAAQEEAAAAAAAAAAADVAAPGSRTRKSSRRTPRDAQDSSAAAAGTTRGDEGVAARPRRVAGVKRSPTGHGDEADSAAGQPERDAPSRPCAGSTKRRKESAAAKQSAPVGGEGEGETSGGTAAAAGAPSPAAGSASDDSVEVSDDDMDLFGDEDDACPSPCDDDGEGGPGAALGDGPGEEREQEENGAAVPASAAAGKAVVGEASSRSRRKANAKRAPAVPKRGGGGGGGSHAGVGARGGKGKGKAAAKTASRAGSSVAGIGKGRGSGRGGRGAAAVAAPAAAAAAAAASAAKDTGGRKRAGGKRKREAGVGAIAGEGGGNGEAEGGRETSNPQRGVVRVVFSGLQQDDRQAAMSVVRSLSKSHRPSGSGVCPNDSDGYTHLVIPDESRRTLKVLFALCAPLSPNGRPPVVVTVSWLYESLEKGFFVDAEAFRPGRYRGQPGLATAMPPAAETHSISSRLLNGERVMLAGVSDPPPEVAESLVQATGAEMTRSLEDATLVLVESEPELEAWVQRMKGHGNGGNKSAGSKSGARLGGGGGGSSTSGRRLAASTSSTRNASGGAGGRSGRGALGKRRGVVEGAAGWGQEKENALEALKSASRVVRLPWLFDSVEKGVRVDIEDFVVRAEGAQPQTTQESVAGAGTSQEW